MLWALPGEARELERQGDIHYTSSLGLASLRETIAGYYQQRFNVDIPADPVIPVTRILYVLWMGRFRRWP